MSELPKGWTESNILDVLDVLSDGAKIHQGWSPRCESTPSEDETSWGALKTTAIQDGSFGPEHNKKLPIHLNPKPKLEVKEQDILITCAGPRSRCGIVCEVKNTRKRLFISGKMYRFRANPYVTSSDYLAYALRSPEVQRAIDELKTGGNESGLNFTQDRFSLLSLPLAPLPEQRRIIAKLDSLRALSARASRELDRIPTLIEYYKQAILAKAFSGELTAEWRAKHVSTSAAAFVADRQRRITTIAAEHGRGRDEKTALLPTDADLRSQLQAVAIEHPLPDEWSWAGLGQVFGIYVGATPSRKEPRYWGGNNSWVSSGEVAFCRIGRTAEHITDEGLDNASTRVHPPGSVLLGMIGEGKTRGQVAILDISACNNQNSAAIRVSEAGYPPEYVYWYLYLAYEKTRTSGAGNNQPALNKDRVQRLHVPLAPPAEAAQVVHAIETAFNWLDKIATEHARAEHLLPKLDQAILAKAFRGELVPQDPSDEPASELLERIKEGREGADRPKRRRARSA